MLLHKSILGELAISEGLHEAIQKIIITKRRGGKNIVGVAFDFLPVGEFGIMMHPNEHERLTLLSVISC